MSCFIPPGAAIRIARFSFNANRDARILRNCGPNTLRESGDINRRGLAKAHGKTRRSAAIVTARVGIFLTGYTGEVLADCLTASQRGYRPMKRWIARLALAEAMTMTSGVFLFGTILLAIAALLTCNLVDEIAAQPAQTPVKAEA
jgi:hypothetical protein